MDNKELNIFKLITQLIAKETIHLRNCNDSGSYNALIKSLRSKAFEIILKKRCVEGENVNTLNSSNPLCHLLALQYLENNEDKQKQIKLLINNIEKHKRLEDEIFSNAVLFLIYLREDVRNTQTLNNTPSYLSTNSLKTNFQENQGMVYKIQSNLSLNSPNSFLGFSSKIFSAKPSTSLMFLDKIQNKDEKDFNSNYSKNLCVYKSLNIDFEYTRINSPNCFYRDEGYNSLGAEIWPIVSQQPKNNHFLWEYLDNPNIVLEKPFACESKINVVSLLQTIAKQKCIGFLNCDNIEPPLIITKDKFIRLVKNMLVGMASVIFYVDDQGSFYLRSGICIENLSQEVLKSFCQDLIFCGTCFRSLSQLCTTHTSNIDTNCGYVFKELCESIKRYLSFYRLAVLSLPEDATLLTLHKNMRKLKTQIGVLAKICKIGPYATEKIYQLPQTSELLTYLYQEVLNVPDKDLALVLYSAFYPCCEIYLHRFLQQWLFEGILVDPYEEFLIKIDEHCTKYRNRTYWTKNFSLKQNALPEFLLELKNSILLCGKTMNLLKLCKPDTPLCKCTIDQSNLITCCLTSDQLTNMKQNMSLYHIEVASLCGPSLSLSQKLREKEEQHQIFLSKVKQKQALTLRRIEMERQKAAEEKVKQKRKIYEQLQEQINIAREQKKKQKEEELKYDLMIAEQNAEIERKKAELMKEETKNIIKYYDELFKAIEDRKTSIEQHKKQFEDNLEDKKKYQIPAKTEEIVNNIPCDDKDILVRKENPPSDSSSEDVFYDSVEINDNTNIDTINANVIPEKISDISNFNKKIIDNVIEKEQTLIVNNAFEEARRNRAKIMNLEFDLTVNDKPKRTATIIDDNSNLTEAQRNKLKVMRAEYQMYYDAKDTKTEINDRINENTETNTNNNLASPGQELIMNINHRNNILSLPKHIEQINTKMTNSLSTNTISNEVMSMSICSTPNTDNFLDFPTPSSSKLITNDLIPDSARTLDTASTNFNEDGFKFPIAPKPNNENGANVQLKLENKIKIKVNTKNETKEKNANDILNSNVKYFLHQSIYVPLQTQMKLVNSEIIKFFLDDQKLFSHLHSLRSYYFLLDGEFGRHITEGIFNKLYEVRDPIDLLNGRCLQLIMNKALGASSKMQENSERLSFTIQSIPQRFNLSNADVLDCLSMSYKITWPLNILLPFDTMEKYEMVFKYILKLHHVSWILQKTFQELKVSCWKGKGIDFNILIQSRQYHRLQLYRHVMTNFIQTLQNYTVSEVLQSSWEDLQHYMESVSTLDHLYSVHIIYLKTIIFRCLLNKQCAPIMKVINEIFVVILKFYNQLRSRRWKLSEEQEFIHPSFKKLEDIFHKFEEYADFVFKVGHKMARVGYQPHLVQMLDMLNMNSYYTNKQ